MSALQVVRILLRPLLQSRAPQRTWRFGQHGVARMRSFRAQVPIGKLRLNCFVLLRSDAPLGGAAMEKGPGLVVDG